MRTKTAWTLLLLGGVLAVPASALAIANTSNAVIAAGAGTAAVPVLSDMTVPTCTSPVLNAVNDIHTRRTETAAASQRVGVTDNDVLLGIALANNGFSDVTWNNIRDVSRTQSQTVTASQTANLDRTDVFSALALGLHENAGSLEALACVADFVTAAQATRTISRTANLDENTVLLAIALHNSVAGSGGGSLLDVQNIDEADSSTIAHDQDITIPREDTFLALALGAGGSGVV